MKIVTVKEQTIVDERYDNPPYEYIHRSMVARLIEYCNVNGLINFRKTTYPQNHNLQYGQALYEAKLNLINDPEYDANN